MHEGGLGKRARTEDGYGMGGGGGYGSDYGSFPCVKLRGLPFDVSEEDVRQFLGLEPIDTILLKRDGRLTGEAFVLLPGNMQVDLALQKNRSYMGRRYIEIYKAKKADYYRGVVSEVEANGMGFHRDGPPPFRRNEPREDRWMGDMDNYGGRDSGGYSRGGPPSVTRASAPAGDNSSGSTIIKLRGLPYSVSDEDICQWFNDDKSLGISPVIKDNVLVVSEHGRPTGIAFVEFPSPAEATAAMGKNRQVLGTRWIEIFAASRADLERHT